MVFDYISSAGTYAERMRIDSSGSLLLGTTTNPTSGTFPRPTLSIKQLNDSGSGFTAMHIEAFGDQSVLGIGYNGDVFAFSTSYRGTGAYRGISFNPGGSEKMRIDSSGNFMVGTTSAINTYKMSVSATNNLLALKIGGTEGVMVDFRDSANDSCGNIYTVGGSNSTAFNTSSDYRLKENAQPMSGALAKVSNLKPVTFTWKKSGVASQGFIAHELAEVVPECVTGEKDAVDTEGNPRYQGVDTSFLVATLTAAIKEQQVLITQLQADVAALKGA
jgi:hypothetical protein